ncbi:hypothetical protein HDU97_007686 [Phlyctochytrium planicorne]|nr:hypothetical protein HDU97_007686 [Phlyctochytrium planicorne]
MAAENNNHHDLKQMLKDSTGLEKVKEDELSYKRFLKMWNRVVLFPNGPVEWDVVGHGVPNPSFCVIFPYFTKTQTTVLILEYQPGINSVRYSFPAGGFDAKKHKDRDDTARDELSEEANLKDATLVPLLPKGHEGIMELKWCTNRFLPYLALDPVKDPNPLPRDAEELITIEWDVKISELENIILRGELTLPSVQTAYMGLNYLRKNGILQQS